MFRVSLQLFDIFPEVHESPGVVVVYLVRRAIYAAITSGARTAKSSFPLMTMRQH